MPANSPASTIQAWPTDMAPARAAQEGTQGGWSLDYAAENTDRPTGAQRIGVVDAVAARQRGGDQRQHLVSRVRPPRRAAEVEVVVDEFPQGPGAGRGWPAGAGRHWPPGGGRQRPCGYGRYCSVVALNMCSLFPGGFLLHNHYPGLREAPSGSFKAWPRGRTSVDSGLVDLPDLWLSQTVGRSAFPEGGTGH